VGQWKKILDNFYTFRWPILEKNVQSWLPFWWAQTEIKLVFKTSKGDQLENLKGVQGRKGDENVK
jgi:hypothetical protein